LKTNVHPGASVGSIKDATIEIENGIVRSSMQFNFLGQTIGFRNGAVRLRNHEILSMTMLLPKEMLPFLREQKFLKPVIEVPVTGSLSKPNFDIVRAALQSVGPGNPLDLIKGLEGAAPKR
jgi:hypothetical protein